MQGPVVVGVDDSDASLRAVEWAAEEARRRGLRLSMVMAFPAPSPDSAFIWPQEEIDRNTRAALDRAEERATSLAPGLDVDRTVVTKSAPLALLQHAEKAAMLVVGLRGRGGFPGLRVGSVAYRVAARPPVPVVVVGPEPVSGDRREVVVGEDGSSHAERAVAEAFAAAAVGSGTVRVVRAWNPPVLPVSTRGFSSGEREAIGVAEEGSLERRLAPWRDRYPSVEVRTEVVESRPVAALVRAAQDARLLVVGASGRHALSPLALGSTAHAMLHRSPCPVMVAHAP